MSAHKVERTTSAHVSLSVVKGGETADSAQHDGYIMEPWDGRYEDTFMRAFGEAGEVVEFRFSAADMRQALNLVEELRRGH